MDCDLVDLDECSNNTCHDPKAVDSVKCEKHRDMRKKSNGKNKRNGPSPKPEKEFNISNVKKGSTERPAKGYSGEEIEGMAEEDSKGVNSEERMSIVSGMRALARAGRTTLPEEEDSEGECSGKEVPSREGPPGDTVQARNKNRRASMKELNVAIEILGRDIDALIRAKEIISGMNQ